jgi:Zn-dependent M28 family amino/carboxypeptidase
MRKSVVGLVIGMTLATVSSASANADVYQEIFQSVSQPRLQQLMKDMTGFNPVTIAGKTFSINDRYLPASKENFRAYWRAYYESLGLQVTEQAFPTQYNLETEGHNLEAVLPGQSKDSVVIIVHYDSMGPHGSDNEAVDDDMTGMAMQMETARLLLQYPGRLKYTVRFVAADYEEWGALEGARVYAKSLKALSRTEGFNIVAGIDDEQSGWKEHADTFDIFDCGGPTDSHDLGNLMAQTAQLYGRLATKQGCMGENSDHYALWEIGVKTVVFSEHDPFNNPHFDHEGGDTYARIAQDYFYQIAQIGVTFAARVVGIDGDGSHDEPPVPAPSSPSKSSIWPSSG